MANTEKKLSNEQLSTLFNILVHYETYREVETFKDTIGIQGYGYPFTDKVATSNGSHDAALSQTPLLQLLLTNFLLSAPGFRDLPPEFWSVKFKGMMERFGKANLSESYDKGTLGTRKRLACAATVLHEGVTRGLLAGLPQGGKKPDLHQEYDLGSSEGITDAYQDAFTALVHNDLSKELFDHLAKTADFESHSPAVKGAMDYAIIHSATLLHYIFVLSGEGAYLVKMVENIHSLIPYNVIRQTLRIGNAATMINGMARLFLAKVGIGAMTNWFGLTKDASDGMNLMQRIISMVLSWDEADFTRAAARIRETGGNVDVRYLNAIDAHIRTSKEQQTEVREKSKRGNMSIIMAILDSADLEVPGEMSAEHHKQCLDYYATQLAIWDREATIRSLCEQSPDFVTGMVRDSIKAFDPMLRSVHDNVDLKKLVTAAENFLNDAIAVSKCQSPENGQNKAGGEETSKSTYGKATVDDYVALLHRHKQGFMYDYLHSVAKSCPDIRDMWGKWISDIVTIFRDTYVPGSIHLAKSQSKKEKPAVDKTTATAANGGAGRISQEIETLFEEAPSAKKEEILSAIDEYIDYLDDLEDISDTRMQRLIDGAAQASPTKEEGTEDDEAKPRSKSGNMTGPGMYLAMFEHLLNNTPITPDTPRGPPRRGKDVKSELGHGKTEAATGSAAVAQKARSDAVSSSTASSPKRSSPNKQADSSDAKESAAKAADPAGDDDDKSDVSSIKSNHTPDPPDVSVIVETLGAGFRKIVAEISLQSLPPAARGEKQEEA